MFEVGSDPTCLKWDPSAHALKPHMMSHIYHAATHTVCSLWLMYIYIFVCMRVPNPSHDRTQCGSYTMPPAASARKGVCSQV